MLISNRRMLEDLVSLPTLDQLQAIRVSTIEQLLVTSAPNLVCGHQDSVSLLTLALLSMYSWQQRRSALCVQAAQGSTAQLICSTNSIVARGERAATHQGSA